MLRKCGAANVVGIDLSEGMIALARLEEEAHPLGIEYFAQDAKDLRLEMRFDVVVAAYLLNYAKSPEELTSMCQAIADCLEPGGRFITVNSNPEMDFAGLPSFRRYGFDVEAGGVIVEGSPFTWTFYLERGPLQVENYHFGTEAHEKALRSARFRNIRWHRPRAAVEDVSNWDLFLGNPPIAFLECVK